MKSVKIPSIAITRLAVYARNLELLDQEGVEVTSSARLADICGINPAQVRKDLAYFGLVGVRGVGYFVKELLFNIGYVQNKNRIRLVFIYFPNILSSQRLVINQNTLPLPNMPVKQQER